TVDGGEEAVRSGLAEAVGDDARFRVVSDGRRLGFYLNFERGLAAVPEEAEWIALSDQDDHWYPSKLEVMLPHLAEVALVSGQARLVQWPEEREIGVTERLDLGAALTMLVNQYTGSLCVFR
ncbi:glycosyltransferase, partial [Mycobacterium tuberculosis]|uniref:glycosyltransferase n=1 Tax=Mycobacterium tuberculosis TaxID=1773 RepID=UPI000A922C0C